MATTLNIRRFIRSVRQGRTSAPVSCTAMSACTQQAFDALLAASWTRVEERESGLPRHNWAQSGFSNNWDASKYCGDYANGYQHGYATAVCYTFRMPAEALTGTVAKISSVDIPTLGDRWLDDGCDLLAYLSSSVTPPVWGAAATDSLTGQLEVIPSNTGTDSSAVLSFDWSASPKTTLPYLHVVLRLTNYLTHRGAWIEGGAMIDGGNLSITFDRDVTPDTETNFDDPFILVRHQTPPSTSPADIHTFETHYAVDDFIVSLFLTYALNNSKVLMKRSSRGAGAYFMRSSTDSILLITSALSVNNFFSIGNTFNEIRLTTTADWAIDARVNVRLVIYGINSGVFSLTAGEWPTDVHDDSASPGSFWRGAASTIKMLYTDAGPTTASLPCSVLVNKVIPGGSNLSEGTYIPFTSSFTPTGDCSLIICISVDKITVTDPPFIADNVKVGVEFAWPSMVAYLR